MKLKKGSNTFTLKPINLVNYLTILEYKIYHKYCYFDFFKKPKYETNSLPYSSIMSLL